MKPAAMTMLHFLMKPPKAAKLPGVGKAPDLIIGIQHSGMDAKPVNDPTDPNQFLESERSDVGAGPSKRIPVRLALPKSPIKPTR